MAKTEKITDDLTGKEIAYPYISARSLRVELSPTKYVWLGIDEVKSFANGANLGKWAEEAMDKAIEDAEGDDRY